MTSPQANGAKKTSAAMAPLPERRGINKNRVIPAKAGISLFTDSGGFKRDSCLRRNDGESAKLGKGMSLPANQKRKESTAMSDENKTIPDLCKVIAPALRVAFLNAAELAKRTNTPLIVERNGRIARIPPEEIDAFVAESERRRDKE
jgi:hypothetical protein